MVAAPLFAGLFTTSAGAFSLAQTLSTVATAVGAIGSIQQGRASQASLNYQAAVQRQQAEREKQAATAREADFRRAQSRAAGTRRAGLTGVVAGEGSPLLATEDFAGEVELSALRIREGGEIRATRLEQAAELSKFQAGAASRAGFFGAGALLARGAGKASKDPFFK